MSATISVFQFDSFRDYLLVRRPLRVGAWAKRLGYRSPRTVAMVLKGQRLPSVELMSRLSQDLRHSEKEHRFFELLVEKSRRERRGTAVEPTLRELARLRGAMPQGRLLAADQFAAIAEWQHFVLRQLVSTRFFREDLAWIKRRLRHKVGLPALRSALSRLEALGLLTRDAQGALCRGEPVATTSDVPSEAIRAHHQQMLLRAQEALVDDPVDRRELTAITIAFDERELPAAKAAMRHFRDEFHARFHRPGGSGVFQLNLQFFEHTSPAPKDDSDALH